MYRWPQRHYREALRVVLGVEQDDALGFGLAQRDAGVAERVGAEHLRPDPVDRCLAPAQVRVGRGRSILITCTGGGPVVATDAGQPTRMTIDPGISVVVVGL
ncbi:MAG: hypothetical protein JXA67_06395 [Micromonosporaceae bacterium]|nr:hypothetical protein [Micromonosporaceae bacterium]